MSTAALSHSVLDDNHGERMVPESSDRATFWEHVYRYAFATHFVRGKRVLDIACGEGYGAAALQRAGAAQVIGVDISEAACLHARRKYGIDARRGDAEHIPLPDSSVDVVVSFETIEHVCDPGRFLDECVRVLGIRGTLIVSTPDRAVYCWPGGLRNPHHRSEMTEDEFATALGARFREVRLSTQRPESVSRWSPRTLLCEKTPWTGLPGFTRLHRSVQWRFFREAVSGPTLEEQAGIVDVVLKKAKSRRRLLNPFVVRPRRKWHRERAVYLVAVAIR